jgi:hypothetical protein
MKAITFPANTPFTRANFLSLVKEATEEGKIVKAELSEENLKECMQFEKQASADPATEGIVKEACTALSEFCGDAPVTIGKTTTLYVE